MNTIDVNYTEINRKKGHLEGLKRYAKNKKIVN